jgi:Spy/CpxP family protein refolding chaperone
MKRRTLVGLMTVSVVALAVGATVLAGGLAQAQGPGGPGMRGGPGMPPGMETEPGMHGPGWRGMHGPGMRPEMMKRMISARLDEALTQASVTPEQRLAIHASRDRAFAALEAQRPDPRAHRDQVLALFEGDKIDAAQLQTLHAQIEQRHQAIEKAITQAIVEIHDTLTPPQRKLVAEYVRQHRPMGLR